jgi:hypothetical protein
LGSHQNSESGLGLESCLGSGFANIDACKTGTKPKSYQPERAWPQSPRF